MRHLHIDDLHGLRIDQRAVLRITQQYPAVRGTLNTVRPYGLDVRVLISKGPLSPCTLVYAHGTATKHTQPDVAPVVFRYRPHVIRGQRTSWHAYAIVGPLAILKSQQATLPGSEP